MKKEDEDETKKKKKTPDSNKPNKKEEQQNKPFDAKSQLGSDEIYAKYFENKNKQKEQLDEEENKEQTTINEEIEENTESNEEAYQETTINSSSISEYDLGRLGNLNGSQDSVREIRYSSPDSYREWKYDGIGQPRIPKRLLPFNFPVYLDDDDLDSNESIYSDELQDADILTILQLRQQFPIDESEFSDVLSRITAGFSTEAPFGYIPTEVITGYTIREYLTRKTNTITEEIYKFHQELCEESLIISSLFMFLIYYITYLTLYCYFIQNCSCDS